MLRDSDKQKRRENVGYLEQYLDLWNSQLDKFSGQFETPILKHALRGLSFIILGSLGVMVLTIIWATTSRIMYYAGLQNSAKKALWVPIAFGILYIVSLSIGKFKKRGEKIDDNVEK